MRYMVCGRAVRVCMNGGQEVNLCVCICPLVYLHVRLNMYRHEVLTETKCVWDSFQWPNTAPIEVSPKVHCWAVARPPLPEACMDEIYARHTQTCTHKSVESPLVCLENPGVLGDWIPSENTHYFSHSVGSVLRLLGINLLRKMKMRRPWAADSCTLFIVNILRRHTLVCFLTSHLNLSWKQREIGE